MSGAPEPLRLAGRRGLVPEVCTPLAPKGHGRDGLGGHYIAAAPGGLPAAGSEHWYRIRAGD